MATQQPPDDQVVAVARASRHRLVLDDEHHVGVSVCGQGLPVVLVHGFTAEGIVYAQTLSRLARLGFKVIAIDVAGHGSTGCLPAGGLSLDGYVDLIARTLDALGVRQAMFVGHSMGGRLVTELVAAEPERAVAVVLLDAAVGQCWDRIVTVARFAPPVLLGVTALLALDTLTTMPWLRDPGQATKLSRLIVPTLVGHLRRPWRLVRPAISLLRSPRTTEMLDALGDHGVPVLVIHGDRDVAVPYATARDAARRSGGTLVTVEGGTHSWVLKDPEVLPDIVAALIDGRLARVRDAVLHAVGLPPSASAEQVEAAFLCPRSAVGEIAASVELRPVPARSRPARHRWAVSHPPGEEPAAGSSTLSDAATVGAEPRVAVG